jgi:hypothetical protein
MPATSSALVKGLFREEGRRLVSLPVFSAGRQNWIAQTSARRRRQRLAQQLDHGAAAKWLFETGECASGFSATSNGLFGKRRNENDWYAASLRDQAILKVKAAHTGHLHIGDQAGAVVNPRRPQEIVSGFEREGDEAERPHEALHCRAN